MLDLCGGAYIQVSDRRTKQYSALRKYGYIDTYSQGIIEIRHAYQGRQEHGLKIACARAAADSLIESGFINLQVRDYVD